MIDFSPIEGCLNACDFDANRSKRVFHGRGRTVAGFEQVTIDWYPPAVFVVLYRPVEDEFLNQLLATVKSFMPERATLVVQHRQGPQTAMEVLGAELPKPHIVQEQWTDGQSIDCYVQLNRSQNVGIFPDMINGRDWLYQQSAGKNVLNLFAYTCLFSVVALKGGATGVVNVDMNKSVMATGRKNHSLNQLDTSNTQFFTHNIFNSWGKIKRYGRYDVIVIDPPSFQKGSFVLEKDYKRLLTRLPELACERAKVMLCVNSPDVGKDFLLQQVQDYCPQLQLEQRLQNHQDFPEQDSEKSLKVFVFDFM